MNTRLVYFLFLLFISALVIIGYQIFSGSDIFKSEPELTGRAVYQNHCANCHGASGGGAATFPDIRETAYSEDQIRHLIQHGRGEMPAFPDIKEPDLSYLVKYVINL